LDQAQTQPFIKSYTNFSSSNVPSEQPSAKESDNPSSKSSNDPRQAERQLRIQVQRFHRIIKVPNQTRFLVFVVANDITLFYKFPIAIARILSEYVFIYNVAHY